VAARLGCLDLNLIKVNGEPIAFGYNYIYNGALVGLRIGYDPKFAKAGVGNVLYLLTFEDSFRRGDTQFDMGVGSLEMKRWWWTRTVQSYRYTHYPLSAPRAQLLRLKHWLFGSRVRDEVPLAEMHVAG
jgi:CelD/BcsL family acetyltransferase involved in cellulose biosynthesis